MSAPDQKWYVAGKGKAFGPYSVEQLRAFLNAAKIKPDSKVCPAGGKTWMRLAEAIPDLLGEEGSPPPPPPVNDQPPLPGGAVGSEAKFLVAGIDLEGKRTQVSISAGSAREAIAKAREMGFKPIKVYPSSTGPEAFAAKAEEERPFQSADAQMDDAQSPATSAVSPEGKAQLRTKFLDLFGLKEGATKLEITEAYRRLAKECDPQQLDGEGPEIVAKAARVKKCIQDAYLFLLSQHLEDVSPPPLPLVNSQPPLSEVAAGSEGMPPGSFMTASERVSAQEAITKLWGLGVKPIKVNPSATGPGRQAKQSTGNRGSAFITLGWILILGGVYFLLSGNAHELLKTAAPWLIGSGMLVQLILWARHPSKPSSGSLKAIFWLLSLALIGGGVYLEASRERLERLNQVDLLLIGAGGVLLLILWSGLSATCPACKKYWARVLIDREELGREGGYKTVTREDKVRNSKGEVIASTTRREQVHVVRVSSRNSWMCRYCSNKWTTDHVAEHDG